MYLAGADQALLLFLSYVLNFDDGIIYAMFSVCPTGWHHFEAALSPRGDMCYKISSTETTQTDAIATCATEGGVLANFKFSAEKVGKLLCVCTSDS